MSEAVLIAIIGVLGTVLGALGALFYQSRRLPSEVRLTEAQTKKTDGEADHLIIGNLTDEIVRLKLRIADLELRLAKSEEWAIRANEYRRAVIMVGERLDVERRKSKQTVEKFVLIIEHLLRCLQEPDQAKTVDQDAIKRLIQTIRDES